MSSIHKFKTMNGATRLADKLAKRWPGRHFATLCHPSEFAYCVGVMSSARGGILCAYVVEPKRTPKAA